MTQSLLSTMVLFTALITPTCAVTLKSPQLNSMPLAKPSDLYIVDVKPIFANTAYRLVIKTEENGKAIMEIIHPLDGVVFDIFIKDVDDDDQEELVVSIADNSSSKQKIHFDVYEFEGKQLSWVENFHNIGGLLSHFDL